MKQHIVKAEILWTRKCSLRCGYCSMFYDGSDPKKPATLKKDWDLWKLGLYNLRELGCGFTAVYGANPTEDMDYLPEFFEYTNKLGMYHTLIASAIGKNFNDNIRELVKAGLNSVTVSFDGDKNENNDKSSALKSEKGFQLLEWIQKEYPNKFRDLSVVFTLTKQNLDSILYWIPEMAKRNIFVFFDLIHHDIGNPGTKVKNSGNIKDLIFTLEDKPLLQEFGRKLRVLKYDSKYRYFIHQSDSFIDMLINRPEKYILKQWNCADPEYKKVFPSWLTVDYNGIARVCDDFHIESGKQWKFWDLDIKTYENDFVPYHYAQTQRECKGCLWNTHFDAHMIKLGIENYSNYVNHSENNR